MRRILSWAAAILFTIAIFFMSWRYVPEVLNWMGVSVADAKTISEILQSVVQTIAIIIAGIWTYERFIKTREEYPYPTIQHRIEDYDLRNGKIYLSVFVTVTNVGKRKLDLRRGKIFIRQVFPVSGEPKALLQKPMDDNMRYGKTQGLFRDSGQRIGWDTLGRREWSKLREEIRELEPGQTREIQFAFPIEDDVKIIEAISYVEYAESSWESSVIYELTSKKTLKKRTD